MHYTDCDRWSPGRTPQSLPGESRARRVPYALPPRSVCLAYSVLLSQEQGASTDKQADGVQRCTTAAESKRQNMHDVTNRLTTSLWGRVRAHFRFASTFTRTGKHWWCALYRRSGMHPSFHALFSISITHTSPQRYRWCLGFHHEPSSPSALNMSPLTPVPTIPGERTALPYRAAHPLNDARSMYWPQRAMPRDARAWNAVRLLRQVLRGSVGVLEFENEVWNDGRIPDQRYVAHVQESPVIGNALSKQEFAVAVALEALLYGELSITPPAQQSARSMPAPRVPFFQEHQNL